MTRTTNPSSTDSEIPQAVRYLHLDIAPLRFQAVQIHRSSMEI